MHLIFKEASTGVCKALASVARYLCTTQLVVQRLSLKNQEERSLCDKSMKFGEDMQ